MVSKRIELSQPPLEYNVGLLFAFFTRLAIQAKAERTCNIYGFKNVSLGDVKIAGTVEMGEGTYIDSGHVQSGPNSVIRLADDATSVERIHERNKTSA